MTTAALVTAAREALELGLSLEEAIDHAIRNVPAAQSSVERARVILEAMER